MIRERGNKINQHLKLSENYKNIDTKMKYNWER